MKNKRNKKLLASVVLSMSLISSISNKAANANYKDTDRSKLRELVSSINKFTNSKTADSKTDVSVSQSLFDAINTIYKNRKDNDPNSVLYKSMKKNMHIENKDLNLDIGKYEKYGPDALKAMILELGVDKFKGGHFTVWNKQTKNAINKATEQINCCDAWFWALGGTKQDIEKYKNKLNSKYDDYNDTIDKDSGRTWIKVGDANVKNKIKILSRVLKVYDSDYHNYSQGFNYWCAIIIDKFVGCENNDISEETEAQIYYVYKTIINKLRSSFEKILNSKEIENNNNKVFAPKTEVVLDNDEIRQQLLDMFRLSNEGTRYNLTLIDDFIDNHKGLSELMKANLYCSAPNIMAGIFLGCYNCFARSLKIKLLDAMIYKDFKNKQNEEIVQNIVNEVCMAIVDDDVNNGVHQMSSDVRCDLYYSFARQYLLEHSSSKLEFSNGGANQKY